MLKKFPFEALFWTTGLLVLAFLNPGDNPITLCPLNNLGMEFCPGCGLGRAITYLFHGELKQSLIAHPLGIFAVCILLYRIFQLTKTHFHTYGKNY